MEHPLKQLIAKKLEYSNVSKLKFLRKIIQFDRRFPAALFLLGVMSGQIISIYWSGFVFIVLAYGVIQQLIQQWGFSLNRVFKIVFCGVFVGCVGVILLLPISNFRPLSSDRSYIVEIDDTPRRRNVGEIKVPIKILAEVRSYEHRHAQDGLRNVVRLVTRPVRYLCRGVDLPWRNLNKAQTGDVIIIKGDFQGFKSSSIFSYDAFLRREGYVGSCKIRFASAPLERHPTFIQKVRASIKLLVEDVLGRGEISGLPLSTALGIKDVLSDVTENNFRKTGLSHVLVVSGYQVTLVYGAIVGVFTWLFSKYSALAQRVPLFYLVIPFALAFTGLFVLLVEPDGPVLRAWLALFVAGTLKILGRGMSGPNALIVGLLSMAVVSPGCYLDPGVELSFAALAGLQIGSSLGKSEMGKFLWSSLVASTLTGFVSAVRFGGFSLTSLLINPFLAPFLSVVGCKLVLLGILFAAVGLDPKGLVLQGVAESLLYSKGVVAWFASLEYGYFEGPVGVALAVVFMTFTIWFLVKGRGPEINPSPATTSSQLN